MQKKIDRPDLGIPKISAVCRAVYDRQTYSTCQGCNHLKKTERQLASDRHPLIGATPLEQGEVRRCPNNIRTKFPSRRGQQSIW